MEAVKKPKHQIMSININRDTVSQWDSYQRKSSSYHVRRLRPTCAHIYMDKILLTRKVEVFTLICRHLSGSVG